MIEVLKYVGHIAKKTLNIVVLSNSKECLLVTSSAEKGLGPRQKKTGLPPSKGRLAKILCSKS